MNEVFIMLNLAAFLVSGLYWYLAISHKDPIYTLAICFVSIAVWYTTSQAAIRVDDLGVPVALLYDLFMTIHILSGFKEAWSIWRSDRDQWWG